MFLITGGSRGIGAAAVRAFSARGDRVAFFYERKTKRRRLSPPRPARLPSAATLQTRRR